MQIKRNKDRRHRSNNNMITTQTNKQASKKNKPKNNRNNLCKKQTHIFIVLIQGNKKDVMKFIAVSAKMLKTVKCLTVCYYHGTYQF